MKFWIIALLTMVSTTLANETVEMSDRALAACKRYGYSEGDDCCSYHDCSSCGFYQRCCWKPEGFATNSVMGKDVSL
ncbi:uncharacterized protein FIESC28_10735 [Fusarium coffeatum]|uniref:Secretory peptide n=1 Tax=Fusarium coffeatum TaxID=231269 RepID=A0A366QSX1_9HYPO|nr:uncharacterized protein FIESC28_10735 [Fusarium coffeatum]RBR07236.1 hypothetical protein FIESC28_10735 [Fusarium coffeatum]